MGGEVRRWSSGGPWEGAIGYSRAVSAGPFVLTAGCTSVIDGRVMHEGDPYGQTIEAFGIALAALEQAGASRDDVVQTRMYVVHAGDGEEVGRAHRAVFGEVRPVATMLVVAGPLDTRMLVEVEVVAYRSGGAVAP